MKVRIHLASVAWLIGIISCGIVVATTRFSADMSAFLPSSPSPTQKVLVDQMQNGPASRLLLIAIENAPTPVLATVSRNFAKSLLQYGAFTFVRNGDDSGVTAGLDANWIWRNRYVLSSTVTATRFTTEGLRRALESDLQLLGSDLGSLMKQSLPADPTGEIRTLLGGFTEESQPSRRDGVWFSPDGRRALLVVQTRNPGFDIASEEQALEDLDTAFHIVQRSVTDADAARIRVIGPGVFAVHTKAEMKEDISRLSLIATILVSALLLFTYRSPMIVLLALVPVASGALAGVAAVSLGFGFVHGITLGFGVTLIGEAVDYAIYLFTQTAPGTSPELTLPRIWPMLRLGVLVSICGFSAMLFSSFTGFAQLGLFSIVGLLVAVAVTRSILPRLVPRKFAGARSAIFAPVLLAIVIRARWLRLPVLALLLGAVIDLAFHQGSFWQDDLTSLSPVPAVDQKLDQSLRSDIGAPDVRYLIVATAPNEQRALEASERLSAVLEDLVTQGVLAGFDAPTRYLPSAVTQQARLDALPAPDVLRSRLRAALNDLPFRPDLFEPFIADATTAKAGPLLDRTSLEHTSLALKLDSLLTQHESMWTALLTLRGVTDAPRVTQSISRGNASDATFVDLKMQSDALLEDYLQEALTLALVGSAVILALLMISLRSPRRVVLVVTPLVGSVLLTTALLTFGNQKLSIFNLVGLLLTVAVGSNYSIFFERQNWNDSGSERMVASLVLANLCTVIGFGILSFARLPVLNGIGTTVAIGAMSTLILSAIVTNRAPHSQE